MADASSGGDSSHGGGSGMSAVGAAVGLGAFIFFLVIVFGLWGFNNHFHNAHVMSVRATDAVGYQAGYMQKQLNDMQGMLNYNSAQQVRWREDELRFGQPYGNHTMPLRRGFGGGVINGSNLTNNETFAAENSVL